MSDVRELQLQYPFPTSTASRSVMRANRRSDTRPERVIRSCLHALGLRFRKDYRVIVGSRSVRVDVAFPKRRLAVFVDGCFWHGCPDHGNSPRSNVGYWLPKLRRNIERDREVDELLTGAGWSLLHVWEHEPPTDAAARVATALAQPPVDPS